MTQKILLLFRSPSLLILGIFVLLLIPKAFGQAAITRIHTDWKGYWTANGATSGTNRPDLENNLIGFQWNGTTYSTGVNDATLISNVPTASIQKFRALKIQSLGYGSSTYFLQGAMIDGSATGRTLTPPLGGSASTPAELASRLTDGINGLSLGTGIANISSSSVFFKVGTNNLNLLGLNDGIPDLIITQVAQPNSTLDVFKFVDASGNLVGNAINVDFSPVSYVVGSYSLDLFNASNGTIASSFSAQETRDIRILGYDTSAFGINSGNAALVDRFVVTFSGSSDCAFIAFNANSLKKAELSLVKGSTFSGCGTVGDVINYSFVVTNTGDVPVTNVTVADPLTGLIISGTQGSTLAVGATVNLTGTYTITATDVTAGKVTNQAKVTGLDPSLNIVEDLSGSAINNDIVTVTNLLTAPTGITGTSAICSGDSTTLTVNGGALVGTGATIEWFAGTCSGTSIGTGNSITVSPTSNTIYYVRYKNNCISTTCISRSVMVNPIPTLSVATQPVFTCVGSPATINLTGLLASSTSTITYTINGGITKTVTGVVANASGVGSFSTGNLTVADNGKILKITGITTTSTTPSCSTVFSKDVNLIVNPDSGPVSLNNVSYPSNASTTYCASNMAVFSITPVLGATGYTWIVPAGWKTVSGVLITAPVNTVTPELKVITGSSAESGAVSVMASNLFCPSSLTVTLSTIPQLAPVVSKTNPTCAVPLGTITVSSPTPLSGRIYIVTGINPVVGAVTNTTGVFSGLTAGDYVVAYQDGTGCVSAPTSTISLLPLVTKTWTSSWSPAGTPSLDDIIIFAGNYSGPSVNGCSCTVKSGATVTVNATKVLKLENGLNVETGGTLIFENGASLVQTNNSANSGNIHYKRTTSAVEDFDYVYWSSPVAGQTLYNLSSQSDKYWSWGVDNWVAATGSDVMAKGQGYIARVPRYTSPQNVEFVGVPFNGDVAVPSKGDTKGNLVGNPYPCAVDATKFIDDNLNYISGTLYYWTHVGNRTLNGAGTQYVYSSNDYASFNSSGGIGAKRSNGTEIVTTKPNGTIVAGQSFFAIGDGTGSLKFTNSMRIGTDNNNSQFFKQASTKQAKTIQRNRVWLNLTNDGGAFKQLLVGYITGASNGFDKGYDGPTFNGNAYVDFYSINDSKKYAIQGRGLPFDPADEVPLGYKTSIAGIFQIGIDEVDGGMVNQEIYLEDKTTNTIHDLIKGAYSFTTVIGEFKDRFVLRYTDTSKLGTGDVVTKEKGVIVSVKNSQIKINSFDSTISSVKVYDLKGSLLYEKDKLGKNEFSIDHFNSSDQFMIVMIQLEDGKWISEEIIFHD